MIFIGIMNSAVNLLPNLINNWIMGKNWNKTMEYKVKLYFIR